MRSSRIGTATVVGCSTRSSHAARSADPWRFSPREAARRRSSAWLAALLALTIVHAAPTPAAGDAASAPAADLAARFVHPPDSARPWVYWFWNNGNVTREGITADLEAMRRVGIGGVILMDVVERFAPPKGPATFMGDVWRGDFQFALAEAARLGLEVNMTNAAGWCGSSGPWITPELSMQKLVVTETTMDGPARFDAVLPKLPPVTTRPGRDVLNSSVSTGNFYGPVAVLAFPATGDGVVPRGSVLDLAARTDDAGRLRWDVPPGKWVVQRIGHVSTGSSTRPPVLGGNGLECDKLSAAAMDLHFAHLIGRLKADAGPSAGRALVATHIDSWEVGSQNWTDDLPAEFQRRRGYSLLPFLPAYALNGKRQIDSKAMGDRFRWDFYQTISDLLAQNYSGRLATLAHGRGMRLTIEGYDLPFGDEATYTAAADEPMTEFWTNPAGPNATKALEMASVAHVYGRPVVGAEAFTSNAKEEWRLYPAVLKAEGDSYLAQGVNRFVFHRYAFQPWLDRAPGSTMGPWGLHYERTNTWWDMSGPWHAYLARCQYLLRQGRYVADVLYLRPQYPNLGTYNPLPPLPAGYRSDQISATALMDRVTVRDGRLALPDGMSYRLLVLPPVAEVTPELAEKVRDLVMAGATVLGPRPTHSPSLSDYPRCDQRVADVARALWGDAGAAPVDRAVGAGRVLSGVPLEAALRATGTGPDLTCAADVHWIHRRIGTTDVYFVANPNATAIDASLAVRSPNGRVERWDPQTGGTHAPAGDRRPGRRHPRAAATGADRLVLRGAAGPGRRDATAGRARRVAVARHQRPRPLGRQVPAGPGRAAAGPRRSPGLPVRVGRRRGSPLLWHGDLHRDLHRLAAGPGPAGVPRPGQRPGDGPRDAERGRRRHRLAAAVPPRGDRHPPPGRKQVGSGGRRPLAQPPDRRRPAAGEGPRRLEHVGAVQGRHATAALRLDRAGPLDDWPGTAAMTTFKLFRGWRRSRPAVRLARGRIGRASPRRGPLLMLPRGPTRRSRGLCAARPWGTRRCGP